MVDLRAGIVLIINTNGNTAGTGFVVADSGLIATCAHVVTNAGSGPGATVRVVLLITGEEHTALVEPEWWRAPDAEDVAILRLQGELSPIVSPLTLDSSFVSSEQTFTTFGFPDIKPLEGMPGKCEIVGWTTERGFPLLQLRSSEITRGFSGAPVVDNGNRVIGMITMITRPDRYNRLTETAFITPVDILQSILPALADVTPEARYRRYLQMAYGFWERRFTSLEMTVEERQALPENHRGWIPPTFSVLESEVVKTEGNWEGGPPAVRHLPLPGGLLEAVNQYRTVILLGEPGSGKSTALAHCAGQLADTQERLPVLIPLRRYELDEDPIEFIRRTWALALQDHLRETIGAREVEPVPLHNVSEAVEPLASRLEHLMVHGRLLFLLDGLNEIPNLSQNDSRISRLATFLEQALAQNNQSVVACRVLDYAALRRPLERLLQQVTLEPLDDQRIDSFLQNYLAAEKAAVLYDWLSRREQRATLELSRAPFFLRLVAFLYEIEGKPPTRRLELLDRYIHVAVRREQERERQDWPPVLLLQPLAEMALVMQERDKLEIWEDEVRSEYLSAFPEGGARVALKVAEGAGLLRLVATTDQRGGRIRFAHQLWQQYLVSRALVRKANYNGQVLYELLKSHLLDDHWREVVVLSAVMLDNSTSLIMKLREANLSDIELQRPLLLVAAALAEGAKTEQDIRALIVEELKDLLYRRYLWENDRTDASDALTSLGRLRDPYTMGQMLVIVRDPALELSKRVRSVEVLSNTGQIAEAAKGWLSLARDRELDLSTRWMAAEQLKTLDQKDEAAQAWLSLVGDRSISTNTRLEAAKQISCYGQRERKVQAWSIIAHCNRAEPDIRLYAANQLGALGLIDVAASILLNLIRGRNHDFWKQVARALRELSDTEVTKGSGELKQMGEAQRVLVTLARNDRVATYKRLQASEALAELGREGEAISSILLIVQDPRIEAWIRGQAANILVTMRQPEQAKQVWLEIGKDEAVPEVLRLQASRVLHELSQSKIAITVLLSLLRSEKVTLHTRVEILHELRKLGHEEEGVTALLSQARDKEETTQIRVWAAQTLTKIGKLSQAAQAWLALIEDIGLRYRYV